MKKIYLYIISILILVSTSCIKNDTETILTNNQSGDYFYISNSKYYFSDNTIEREIVSQGGIYLHTNTGLHIEVYPNIGYSFTIEANNLQTHGDTTTFSISMQQIRIQNQTFNLTGTNSIDVGNLGKYDGYFTTNKIVFAYKSYNVNNYEWVETHTEANKKQ